MPTSAVTGTKGAKGKTPEVEAPPVRVLAGPQPLADPNGNGTVQATGPDGRIVNVNAAEEGWEDKVLAVDPKHPIAYKPAGKKSAKKAG